ncbi:MAG: glycosyltransferase family 4 protein [Haloarculaceae archaeon]
MHVALISPNAYSASVQYPSRIANELVNIGVDVTVFIPDTDESRRLLDDSSTVYYPSELSKFNKFTYIYKNILSISPDIVHYPFFGNLSTLLLSVFTLPTRIPHVATLHDPTPHSGMTREIAGIEIRGLSRRMIAARFDGILVHGPQSAKEAIEYGYPRSLIHTVPHGLYDHFPRNPSVQTTDFSLLFFGHIRPNKGYDRIPEILDVAEEKIADINATVAGPLPGPSVDSDQVTSLLQKLDDDERISVRAEYIGDEEVSRLFERSKLVVLPYYDGTMSGVLMTAYHFEKPVVATNVGDIGPTVSNDQSGRVVEAADTRGIGERISELLLSPTVYSNMVENIRVQKDKYKWQNICVEIRRVYDHIL